MSDLKVLATGLMFPEGPIWEEDGSILLVEIERETLTRVRPNGKVEVVAQLPGGPNGAAMGPDGAVYVCNNGGFLFQKVAGLNRTRPGVKEGYKGGWIDEISLRVMDALRVFPSIILALAIVSATGQTLANVVLVIGILDVPVFARLVRAEVLALRAGGFVEAAVNAGNPTWRILFVHLLPNCMRGALAQMPIRMAWAVRVSATLAFIGVGIQVPTPEWGAMIRQGAEFIISGEWWVSIVPGLTLVVLVIGFSMLGDGFEEVLDPRRNTRAR